MEVGNDMIFMGTASNLFAPDSDELIAMILETILPGIDFETWISKHSDLFARLIGPGTEIWTASDLTSTPVPEPGTILLFGIGLLGIAKMSRRKK